MKNIRLIIILSLLSTSLTAGYYDNINTDSTNFRSQLKQLITEKHNKLSYKQARTFLFGQLELLNYNGGYAIQDVYCERLYTNSEMGASKIGVNLIPDNTVLNCEHTWPKSRFGKGSDYKRAPHYKYKVSDLHHLYVSDSKMNSTRGNLEFAEIAVQKRGLECPGNKYGFGYKLNGELSKELYFEPPANHKGNVARALFYFAVRYDMQISQREEETLRRWHLEDPVDESEIYRNEEIYKVQFNRNPFIDHPEFADLIENF